MPYADSGPLAVKLLKNGRLKTLKGLPHGCCQTNPDLVNPEILSFIRGEQAEMELQPAAAAPEMA